MGTYRKEWSCCHSVTETSGWEPESCPFCEPVVTLSQKPVAFMRKWAFDKEKPEKVRGRWPVKFKFLPLTEHQVMVDDVPLVALIEKK